MLYNPVLFGAGETVDAGSVLEVLDVDVDGVVKFVFSMVSVPN
jgi:hypothetical protein